MTPTLMQQHFRRKCQYQICSVLIMTRSYSFSSLNLRVFDDPTTQKMWKASVKDIDGEILCVSQFTLMANTTKSNKPDFHRAMVSGCDFCPLNVFSFFVQSTEPSRQLYSAFLDTLRSSYKSDKIHGAFFTQFHSLSNI